MHHVGTGDNDNHCRDGWQDDKIPNKATTVKKSPASSNGYPPWSMLLPCCYPAVPNSQFPTLPYPFVDVTLPFRHHNFPPRRVHLILCFPITTFLLDLVYFRLSVLCHSGSIATHLTRLLLWISFDPSSIFTLYRTRSNPAIKPLHPCRLTSPNCQIHTMGRIEEKCPKHGLKLAEPLREFPAAL